MTTIAREDVGLSIGGREWIGWSDIEIKRCLDSVSTFSFTAPFEPERQEFRDTFRPFSYAPVVIGVNGELVLNGTMLGVEPSLEVEERSVAVSGYGLPGVLLDCTMPASAYPIAWRAGHNLQQIAQQVCSAFGLQLVVEGQGSETAPFDAVKIEPTQSPFAFLADLAKQRSMVVSDTPEGALRLWAPPTGGAPVAKFVQWRQPATTIKASFKPQEFYSEITGLKGANAGRGGAMWTERNPFLSGVTRPKAFTVEDADKGDVGGATLAELARMLGNAVTVTVDVPTWRDASGALWTPNALVTVEAPGCMIYSETDFVIREVTLKRSADSVTASLELALPGAFSGEMPERMPWD